MEGKSTIGGGLRTAELTLPGFKHDICSAIHPMAVASPFFNSLPLEEHSLEYIQPPIALAHPYDNGTSAILTHSIEETASLLGIDKENYLSLIGPIKKNFHSLIPEILGPLHIPKRPIELAQFGLNALQPATWISKRFRTSVAKGLWAGMAAHSILPLNKLTTSAIGLVLLAAGHSRGWPIPKGGSQQIANALASYFTSLGGKIETSFNVESLAQLPSSKAVLFDITPRQLPDIVFPPSTNGNSKNTATGWEFSR